MAELKKISSRKKNVSKNPFERLPIAKIGYIVTALVLTIALFIGLLIIQDRLSNDITYIDVIAAKKDIPEGEIITEENIDKYFTTQSINQLNDIKGSIKTDEVNKLLNKRAKIVLHSGEVVCDKDFNDLNKYTDKIKHPVEVALSSENLAAFNGGTIRKGDIVNISIVQSGGVTANTSVNKADKVDKTEKTDEEPTAEPKKEKENVQAVYGQYQNIWEMEKVYISEVKDSAGVTIANTDMETPAALIIITIEKEDAINLDKALNKSTQLRLAKVLYE